MKNLLLLFATAVAVAAPAVDWRVDAYDKARTIVARKNRELIELLMEAEPKLADWCSKSALMWEAKRKAERYGFMKMLGGNSPSIVFDKPENWLRSFDIRSQQAADLARVDSAFAALARDFWTKLQATGGLNPPADLFEPVRERIAARALEIELRTRTDFELLEAEVKRANQAPEPTR